MSDNTFLTTLCTVALTVVGLLVWTGRAETEAPLFSEVTAELGFSLRQSQPGRPARTHYRR